MDEQARDTAAHTAQQIQREECARSEHRLRGPTHGKQCPHVEREVEKTEMHEHRGDESPPLAVQREGTEVRAPMQDLLNVVE